MSYLGTKPANSPLTSELIPNSIITNAKINDVAATKLTGTVPDANAPSGSVIQVVSATTSTPVTITGTTYTDSGLSASITPTSAANRILVLVNQYTYIYTTSSNAVAAGTQLLRDSTVLLAPNSDATGPLEQYIEVIGSTQIYNAYRDCINFLDSPATTSSVTYKTQGRLRVSGSGRALVYQSNGSPPGTSTIVLMEIAA